MFSLTRSPPAKIKTQPPQRVGSQNKNHWLTQPGDQFTSPKTKSPVPAEIAKTRSSRLLNTWTSDGQSVVKRSELTSPVNSRSTPPDYAHHGEGDQQQTTADCEQHDCKNDGRHHPFGSLRPW
jgi:hypothetical protein